MSPIRSPSILERRLDPPDEVFLSVNSPRREVFNYGMLQLVTVHRVCRWLLTVIISAFSRYPTFEPAKMHKSESMKAAREQIKGKSARKRILEMLMVCAV
jgi:hypothetical protein